MSHPSSPKNGLEKRRMNKNDLAFYESPSGLPTPSQIIKEAKEKLRDAKVNSIAHISESSNLVRTLSSTRPFTPREEKRVLFGPKSTRPVSERPPSSFCIGSKSFESDSASRPISATRLSPIERSSNTKLSISNDESNGTTKNEETTTTRVLKAGSPKANKSRLAPLDIQLNEKKVYEKEKYGSTSEPGRKRNDSLSKDGNETTQEDTEALLNWKNLIEPLLNQMDVYFKDAQIDHFCEACDSLNLLLDKYQMYSKSFSKRAVILKIIFKYLDTDSDMMRIKVLKIILNMKVASNNLTNVCRLLFSMSRNTENDAYFLDNEILDSFFNSSKRLDFKENSDSVVYFAGTIKNLSENQKLLKQMSLKNVEEILTKLIKDLSKYYKDNETLKSEAGHALVQITSTLRNLADLTNTRQKFLNLNLIEHLAYVLKYYTSDGELMLNVSRILSKLTLHADCCHELIQHDSCYKSFIKVMIKHESKQDLIVRIAFILGNVTSRFEEARIKFVNEKYSIETLINTLKYYLHVDIKENHQNSVPNDEDLEYESEKEPTPNEDVMIKLIRVLANLAISEEVGCKLANKHDLIDMLLKLLEIKDVNSCEELVIDAIVTINNLSYYNSELIYLNLSQKIINCLMKYLLSKNNDAILEVFRVFANLSRDQAIRNYLVTLKVNQLAVVYLNSDVRELVYIVIGVLINMMTDAENHLVLREEKGVKKLIEILNEIGPADWQLSSMICKVFMNYSEKAKTFSSLSNYFSLDEIKLLQIILSELLDEKFALRSEINSFDKQKSNVKSETDNINEYMNLLWEQDFYPVASLLLKRINDLEVDKQN